MTLSVYVHFPYCLQKCPYCDFASASIQRSAVPGREYADAVLRELDARASSLSKQAVTSIFFGGGTPSLWEPRELGRVLSGIRGVFARSDSDSRPPLEVTVECNPSSLDRARAAALREVGVNRLSIGVQSLDPERLRFLGRLHDGPGALRALRDAQLEMPRVSADLMFGMPGQRGEDFVDELETVLALELMHLSVYALTIEPDTQFGALHRKGRLQLAPEGDFADTFARTAERLAERGFEHYEVSNYATPGEASRHNQHYWRAGAYLGLGAGAVGCIPTGPDEHLTRRRYRNTPKPEAYMVADGRQSREVFEERLSPSDRVREALMLGLRTALGVSLSAVTTSTGEDPLAGRQAAITRQIALGNLKLEDGHLRVPETRWLHLDSIISSVF